MSARPRTGRKPSTTTSARRNRNGAAPQGQETSAASRISAHVVGDLRALGHVAEAQGRQRLELVNFRQIVQASLWCRSDLDEAVRNEAGEILPKLIDAFSEKHGGILKMSVYDRVGAGVALTDIDRAARTGRPALHVDAVASERRDLRASRLVIQAIDLHNRALKHLSKSPRRILVLRLHGIVETLLSQLEGGRAEAKPLEAEDYAAFEQELTAARHVYDESVQRTAHIWYLFGTWLALMPFLVIGAFLVIDPSGGFKLSANEQLLIASTLSGAAGAVVSVMTRLSGRNLTLTGLDEASRWMVYVFGGVRTVLGAAFGALVFLFIFSTVLDIKVPEAPANSFETRLYFIIVLGFFAGFSERFARDTIAGAESSLGASGGVAQTTPTGGGAQQGGR